MYISLSYRGWSTTVIASYVGILTGIVYKMPGYKNGTALLSVRAYDFFEDDR